MKVNLGLVAHDGRWGLEIQLHAFLTSAQDGSDKVENNTRKRRVGIVSPGSLRKVHCRHIAGPGAKSDGLSRPGPLVTSEIVTALKMRLQVFWVLTPRGFLGIKQRFVRA
jgi:hypothetical protein